MIQASSLHVLGRWYERHGRRLPSAAVLLLVLLLGHLLARLLWALWPIPDAGRWRPAQLAAAPGAQRAVDIQAAIDAHLFGDYRASADPNGAASAPETRLSLSLLGILSNSVPERSRALIASSDGAEKPFAIGDDVISGVSLQAIFADRVVLSRGGTLETLRLNKDAPSQGGAPSTPITPVGGDATTQMIGRIRDEVLTDPSRASQYIRVQPANVNGQLKGFRVYPGRERQPFNQIGLRPGDLVTSVNGIQLDDTQKSLQMLTELGKASSVTLTVDRGGQSQTFNVTLN